MHHLARLFPDRGHDFRDAVADHRRKHAAEPVEVAIAFYVPDIAALAPVDRYGVSMKWGNE